jgi:asparagine synthase (glutamine-hydrolysing)
MHTLLAGDGGDEIFGGNARYATQLLFDKYSKMPALMRCMLERMPAALVPHKVRRYVEQARLPMPDRLESYNFFLREGTQTILEPEFLRAVNPEQPIEDLRGVYARPAEAGIVNRMLALDWKITLADNDLRKVGGMCDLAGITVRYPMLDPELVDFTCTMPSRAKVRGGELRWFFKKAMQGFLPDATITKTKHGFGLPFGLWMREPGPLRDLALDCVQGFRKRGIVRGEYIDSVLERHASGHATYYGGFIWVLAMLELWLAQRLGGITRPVW